MPSRGRRLTQISYPLSPASCAWANQQQVSVLLQKELIQHQIMSLLWSEPSRRAPSLSQNTLKTSSILKSSQHSDQFPLWPASFFFAPSWLCSSHTGYLAVPGSHQVVPASGHLHLMFPLPRTPTPKSTQLIPWVHLPSDIAFFLRPSLTTLLKEQYPSSHSSSLISSIVISPSNMLHILFLFPLSPPPPPLLFFIFLLYSSSSFSFLVFYIHCWLHWNVSFMRVLHEGHISRCLINIFGQINQCVIHL